MSVQRIDIGDRSSLVAAMNTMEPGDQIEVQGSESPITIGVPPLESEMQEDDLPPQQTVGAISWMD